MPDPITPDVLQQYETDDGLLHDLAVYPEGVAFDAGDDLLEAAKARLLARVNEGHHLSGVRWTALSHGAITDENGKVVANLGADDQVAVHVTAGQVPS